MKVHAKLSQISLNNQDSDFESCSESNYNRKVLKYISQFVGLMTADNFLYKILDHSSIYKNFVNSSREPTCDSQNRASYFYVRIGPIRLPIFQPGTIMLYSGVYRNSPVAIDYNGKQTNGSILTLDSALFLMEFLARLAYHYSDICDTEGLSLDKLSCDAYKRSLAKCFDILADEDCSKYGVLRELQKMLVDIDERLEIDFKDQKKFLLNCCNAYKQFFDREPKNMTELDEFLKDFEYYSDWENQFRNECPEKIENRVLWLIKNAIINNKDIFQEDWLRQEMDIYLEKMIKLMLEKRCTTDSFDFVNPHKTTNYADLLYTKSYFYLPTDNYDINESVLSTKSKNVPKITIKKSTYNTDMDFSVNSKMVEYYLKIKNSVRSIFLCQIFSDKDLFNIDQTNLTASQKTQCEYIPELGLIFKLAGIKINNTIEEDLKLKQAAVSDTCIHYDNLPENIAKMMVLIKRDALNKMKEPFDDDMLVLIRPNLVKLLEDKNLTCPEIQAIRDTKILEAVALMLVNQGKFHTKHPIPIESYISLLVSSFIKYDNGEVSGPIKMYSSEPQIIEWKRYNEIDFDENLCKNPDIPKALIRKPNEGYDIYLARISDILKDFSAERVAEILKGIDSSISIINPQLQNSSIRKYEPNIKLLENIIKLKNEESVHGNCLIM